MRNPYLRDAAAAQRALDARAPAPLRVTISGGCGAGKSHLLGSVILPALERAGYAYTARDGGIVTFLPSELRGVYVSLLATNDVEEADAHARGVAP